MRMVHLLLGSMLSAALTACGGSDNAQQASAPSIISQPASQTVTAGQPATFAVSAAGTTPLSYQWTDNGSPIQGATRPTYTTAATTAGDSGTQFSVVVANVAGKTTSKAAILTVLTPPAISTQPASLTVAAGQNATFTVTASGTAPLSYQWMDNGNSITGATSATYTTAATTAAQSGSQFTVVVSNLAGSVTSNTATLSVATLPSITDQPNNETVTEGHVATFTVSASGTAPLSYQWLTNGNNISGANSATYTIPAANQVQNGSQFTVAVSNAAGTVISNSATLTVVEEAQSIKTVFLILMENKDWSYITSYNNAPYINHTLVPMGAHTLQYYNPAANHPPRTYGWKPEPITASTTTARRLRTIRAPPSIW